MERSKNMFSESDANSWEQIPLPIALSKFRDHTHVAHCMLWFKTSPDQSHHISYSFLQLRFDGLLGFPGGIVDEDVTDIESIIDALQREMREEINYCDPISVEDYFYSYFYKPKKIVSHFFVKQIPLKEAEQLEQSHTKAPDFPRESLGLLRIPIGCSYDSQSGYLRRFIKNFMQHKFSGNVKKQIIDVCEKFNVMTQKDLEWTKSQL
jgi:U8 snoRNA-decapping enzyme